MARVQINKRAVRDMTQAIQRELDRNHVRVRIDADTSPSASAALRARAPIVNNYHAPVVTVNGDHAQVAWNNAVVNQEATSKVTQGYEDLAAAVGEVLKALDVLPLSDDEVTDVREQAEVALTEITKPKPDRGVLKRCVTMLKGLLAAGGVGVAGAITDKTTALTTDLIHQLVLGFQ